MTKGASKATSERPAPGGTPPFGKHFSGENGLRVLVVTERGEQRPVGPGVRAAGPAFETIRCGCMIGASAERFLQLLERLLAPRPYADWKYRGENLQCIAKLFALDAEGVNLVSVTESMVGLLEKRCDHRFESPPGEDPKPGLPSSTMHHFEESIDPGRPVGLNEFLEFGTDGRL
jgi:hypothetical protein